MHCGISMSIDDCCLTILSLGITEQETSDAICSDSQAALKALHSANTFCSLVAQTMHALSLFNRVGLRWVPGHCDVAGNEIANQRWKQAANQSLEGPEPFLGSSRKWFVQTSVIGLLLLLACAKSHMLSASRQQPHLLHVSAVDRRQTWSMDKS